MDQAPLNDNLFMDKQSMIRTPSWRTWFSKLTSTSSAMSGSEAASSSLVTTFTNYEALAYIPLVQSHVISRSGVYETSMYFGGSVGSHPSYISSFANDSGFNVTSGNASWAFWVLYDPAGIPGNIGMIMDRGYGYTGSYSIYLYNNYLNIRKNDTGAEYTCATPLVSSGLGARWIHCGIVKSGTGYLFYLNGAYVNTVAGADFVSYNATPTTIGVRADFGAYHYIGLMSEIIFYNRGITATEMLHLSQLDYSANDYVARFRLDESSGTTISDATGNHNGTASFMTRYLQGGPNVPQGYVTSPICNLTWMPSSTGVGSFAVPPLMQVVCISQNAIYVALNTQITTSTEQGWVIATVAG